MAKFVLIFCQQPSKQLYNLEAKPLDVILSAHNADHSWYTCRGAERDLHNAFHVR